MLEVDAELRQLLKKDLAGLPAVPTETETASAAPENQPEPDASPSVYAPQQEQRDEELIRIETQVRVALRDALNRKSRKPFYWGGLKGYEQLTAIAQALGEEQYDDPETAYLRQLQTRVEQVVETYRVNADDLKETHTWLRRIADCLRYPPSKAAPEPELTGKQVKQEMDELLQSFQPDFKRRQAQAALHAVWHRTWEAYGSDLLPSYDIPGLPQDNLMLESLFGRLRRHQRRISGRKSTRELRDFGQYQVLFLADSEEELLEQIRQVPLEEYLENRKRLEAAEAPRRLLNRLHRNPLATMRNLLNEHAARRTALSLTNDTPHPQPGDT